MSPFNQSIVNVCDAYQACETTRMQYWLQPELEQLIDVVARKAGRIEVGLEFVSVMLRGPGHERPVFVLSHFT